MRPTITQILMSRHGIEARPGTKVECPFCRHGSFSIKKDDTLGKCFHPTCGRCITPFATTSTSTRGLFAALEEIGRDFHQAFLDLKDIPGRNAYTYCLSERALHPRVLIDFPLGVVPHAYDAHARFAPLVAEAESALAAARTASNRTKISQQRVAEAETALAVLTGECKTLTKVLGQAPGWLVFIYTDAAQRVVAYRFRRPFARAFQSFKPTKIGGCFGHGVFSADGAPRSVASSDPLVVVEGEFNLLQLQSLCARHAEADGRPPEGGYVSCCAVGGVGNTDTETVRRLSKRPVVCYDHDRDAAGEALVETLRACMAVEAFTTPEPDSDLDSFIRSFGDEPVRAHSAVKALVAARTLHVRPYDSVRADIDRLRDSEGSRFKTFRVRRGAADLIVEDLTERGVFYHDQIRGFYFLREERLLLEIHPDDQNLPTLLGRFGIAPSEQVFRHVLDAMRLQAQSHGTPTTVHSFSFYASATHTLYLFDLDRGIHRIQPDRVEHVENGTDGVLFLKNPELKAFSMVDPRPAGSPVDDLIVSASPFSEGALTADEQKIVFLVWFYSLFFPELFPTRPLLAIVGDRGGAKSFRLRKAGRLLFGPSFNVYGLTDDAKDFDAALTNSHFVVVDNADKPLPWLEDRLALAATGGKIPRRDYYTTNRLVSFPIRAFIALTSRTPNFRREDVADRLLILRTPRLKGFLPEAELLATLDARRDAAMTEIVGQLQEIVRALRDGSGTSYSTGFRMADFANFALRIAHAQGFGDRMAEILERMATAQTKFALEGELIVELLETWLTVDNGRNVGRRVTTAELHKEFAAVAASLAVEFTYKNAQSIAQTLRHKGSALREIFEITKHEDSGNVMRLSFRWVRPPGPSAGPGPESQEEAAHAV